MANTESRFTVGVKLYIFTMFTVLAAAIGTALLAYQISADQIDRYYKQVALDSATTFSAFVDGDYLAQLRQAAETPEYQALRETAEKNEDEEAIRTYLVDHGLWDQYSQTRADLMKYLNGMNAIKYLYIIACGDKDAHYDMYLIDDYDNPLYETGYYENRKPEFWGCDFSTTVEPVISSGDWGWLCSAYAPVYDSNGNVVCQIGCDFGMDDVMAERNRALLYIIMAAIILTAIVLAAAVVLVNRIIINPLNALPAKMKEFHPSKGMSYEEAGVVNLDIRSHDEMKELYKGIRSMQINIIDYLNDLDVLKMDVERAEEGIKTRDARIGEISKEAYRDALTGVGSKAAYVRKVDELNDAIAHGCEDIAMVMVDMNGLKGINDTFGHKSGDAYIQGCCHLICDVFKRSPVFRIGGDEFVAIVQGSDFEHRFSLVDELGSRYAQAAADTQAEPWQRFSAAVGMAELSFEDRTVDLLFKRADAAMYEEKRKAKEDGATIR